MMFPDRLLSAIADKYIRECLSLIKGSKLSDKEKWILQLTFQLMRLSFEHDAIMKTHNCGAHFAYLRYANAFRAVSKSVPFALNANETNTTNGTAKILDILYFLLEQNPIKNVEDFLERRDKFSSHREYAWSLSHKRENVAELIKHDLNEFDSKETLSNLSNIVFGKGPVERVLNLGIQGWTLSGIIGILTDDIISLPELGNITTFVVASSLVAYNVYKDKKEQNQTNAFWPAVLVYNTKRPTKDQVRTLVHDLEYLLVIKKEI